LTPSYLYNSKNNPEALDRKNEQIHRSGVTTFKVSQKPNFFNCAVFKKSYKGHLKPHSSKPHKGAQVLFAFLVLLLSFFITNFYITRAAAGNMMLYMPSPETRLGFNLLVQNNYSASRRLVITLQRSGDAPQTLFDGSPPVYSAQEGAEQKVLTVNMRGKVAGTYILSASLKNSLNVELAAYSKTWTKTWVDYPTVGIDENNAILRNNVPIYPIDKMFGEDNYISSGWHESGLATGYAVKSSFDPSYGISSEENWHQNQQLGGGIRLFKKS
jgi:hypothetical protein